jgi:hypothetical protein
MAKLSVGRMAGGHQWQQQLEMRSMSGTLLVLREAQKNFLQTID